MDTGRAVTQTAYAAAMVLSFYEFAGMLIAVLRRRTKAYRRLLMRFSVFLLIAMIYWQDTIWNDYISILGTNAETSILPVELGMEDTPFVIAMFTSVLVAGFLTLDILSLIRARKKGLTRNVSRLYSSAIVLACIIPILSGTLRIKAGMITIAEKTKTLFLHEDMK